MVIELFLSNSMTWEKVVGRFVATCDIFSDFNKPLNLIETRSAQWYR